MTSEAQLPAFDPSPEADLDRGTHGGTGLIPQIGEVSGSAIKSRHMVLIDQLIDWMLLNPGVSISKASNKNGGPFQMTPMWLRQVASADAFKARLAQKQQDLDVLLMVPSLRDRLAAVTEAALERMSDMIPVATDPDFVKDSTEMLLEQHYKLGLPQGNAAGQGGAMIHVDSVTIAIAEGRQRILEGKAVVVPQQGDDHAGKSDTSDR